jgi:hypothetical protein
MPRTDNRPPLARCALAATVLAGTAALGPATAGHASAASTGYTRGFDVVNASTQTPILATALNGDQAAGPDKGTPLQRGTDHPHHFEVTWQFFHNTFAVVDYYGTGPDKVSITLKVAQGIPGSANASCVAWGALSCRIEGTRVVIGDAGHQPDGGPGAAGRIGARSKHL